MKVEDNNINETTKQNGSPQDLSNSQLKGEKTKRKKRSSKKNVDINSSKSNEPQKSEATGHDFLNTTDAEIENKDKFVEEILISNSENDNEEILATTEKKVLAEIGNSTSEEVETEVVAESEAETETSEEVETEVVAESKAETETSEEVETEVVAESKAETETSEEIETEVVAESKEETETSEEVETEVVAESKEETETSEEVETEVVAESEAETETSEEIETEVVAESETVETQAEAENLAEVNDEIQLETETITEPEIQPEIEPEQQPKKKRRITFFKLFLSFTALFTLGCAIYIVSLFLTSETMLFNPKLDVELPNFQGMTTNQIEANEEFSSFNIVYEAVYTSEVATGVVIEQRPKAPRQVKEGSNVTLRVSVGTRKVEVPDVTGLTSNDAKEKLRDNELYVLFKPIYDDEVLEDYVVKTEPENGAYLDAGETITVYISRGEEEATTAKVPNCVGMTSTKTAGQIIASRGLRLDTVKKVLSDAPEGTIISQSPSEGMVVPRGTGVILTVASSEAGLLAADHAHDFAVSVVEPNSYSIGFTLYTCTICGYYYYTNVTGPI